MNNKNILLLCGALLAALVTTCSLDTPLDPDNKSLNTYQLSVTAVLHTDSLFFVTKSDSVTPDTLVASSASAINPAGYLSSGGVVTTTDKAGMHTSLTWTPPAGLPADSLLEYIIYADVVNEEMEGVDSIGARRSVIDTSGNIVANPATRFIHYDLIPMAEQTLTWYYSVTVRKTNRYEGQFSDYVSVTLPMDTTAITPVP